MLLQNLCEKDGLVSKEEPIVVVSSFILIALKLR